MSPIWRPSCRRCSCSSGAPASWSHASACRTAPPMGFLAWRFALSVAAFAVWVLLSRAAWPRGRSQWLHLAVVGVLMHAGYLGGRVERRQAGPWRGHLGADRRPAAGADGVVGIGHRPGTPRRGTPVAGLGAGPGRAGAGGVEQARRRRGDRRQSCAVLAGAAVHHHRHVVPEAPCRALRRTHRQPGAAAGGLCRGAAAGTAGDRSQ